MSIIGTGIAASVANTGTAARNQAANSSGQDAQRANSAKETDKVLLSQLQGAGATRDTDEEMPDGQAPGYEELYQDQAEEQAEEQANPNDQIHEQDAPSDSPTHLHLQPTYNPTAKSRPLFRKIDVKA